ncbi:hypothetical protein AIQ94_23080 [Salmonella enterica]|nr:hypothetical protein [Salmonella enterica]
MTTGHFYPESLDDEYMDIMHLMDDLSTVKIDIKVRKASIYKYRQSEHQSKEREDYFSSSEKEVIYLEEQKKRLEAKIDSFPPLPVLPPLEPLIKISGTVDEITCTKALACFDVGAYTTMQEQLERKRRRDSIGTSAAMVAQVLAGSAPHVGKTDNVWQRDKSVYVQGKIDGRSFAGWVEAADVQSGEQVMMAAVPDGDGYMIYAIVACERNVFFLPPKCQRGEYTNSIKIYVVNILCAYILLSPIFVPPLFKHGAFIGSFVIYNIFSLFVGTAVYFRILKKYRPYAIFFKKIDDVLHLDGYTEMTLWKLEQAEKNKN